MHNICMERDLFIKLSENNLSGPIRTQVRAYAGLMGNMGGAVRALKIMLRCGCRPPQDNAMRCGAGAGLACAGRCLKFRPAQISSVYTITTTVAHLTNPAYNLW